MAEIERIEYDEFAYFKDNADEFGIAWNGPPVVRREFVDVGDGRKLSALVWGDGPPELVLVHGGAQNAHTWDTVALALGRPLIAVDLPGHGHSDGGKEGSLDLSNNASDVAAVIRALATPPLPIVGMSLGGMTTIALTDVAPEVVESVTLVDVTPGVNGQKAGQITAFINGPESFPSFAEILARTIEFNPTRTESSLRRGILHNALQREDGSWVWRYARFRNLDVAAQQKEAEAATAAADAGEDIHDRFNPLWDVVSKISVPLMLVRGMRPQSVVDDADEAELLARQPGTRVEHVQEAGHSVQGDTPVELARLLESFCFSSGS